MWKPDWIFTVLAGLLMLVGGSNLVALVVFLPAPVFETADDKPPSSGKVTPAHRQNDAHQLLPPSRSFPKYGTPSYERKCRWAQPFNPLKDNNCTILGSPRVDGNEGMSAWVSLVVSGFVMAQQAGCHFLMDYSTDVDITKILKPRGWQVPTTPSGFTCEASNHCFEAEYAYSRGGGNPNSNLREYLQDVMKQKSSQNLFFSEVPPFRQAYSNGGSLVGTNQFKTLKRSLGDDFDLETSMACALERLFELAPTARMFQPDLFTTLLPTLRKPDAFVMTLYVRSGHTEHVDKQEPEIMLERFRHKAQLIVNCALGLEHSLREVSGEDNPPVVWMLVTDSPYLREWIIESYGGNSDENNKKRTILTTQARGAHTKFRGQTPSTADFAEAFLDWYLIGEGTDAVIADYTGPSFGDTGTFRTARPYYKVPKDSETCTKVEPRYKW